MLRYQQDFDSGGSGEGSNYTLGRGTLAGHLLETPTNCLMEVQLAFCFHNIIVCLTQAWGSASLDTPDMLARSRKDSALGLASLETVLAAFASFLAVDGASLLPALEHLDPQAVLLLQHARLQCEVDPAFLHQKITHLFRFKVWRQETWLEQHEQDCLPERGW